MDIQSFYAKGGGKMRFLSKKGIFDSGRVQFLPVDAIVPNPHQPRTVFPQSDLEELAGSIQALGVLQPLTVRRREGGWELIAGERRLRAAKLAGLREVPCLALQVDSQASSLMALVENLQRRDLDFLEEAQALRRLIDVFHLSQEEAARRLGKSQSAIANKLRLLKLSPAALTALQEGGCTERHARALLRLPDAAAQEKAALRVVEQRLTVAQTEDMVEALALAQSPRQRRRTLFIMKDVRVFLNTVTHGLDLIRSSGVDAKYSREDTEEDILLTIRIPRKAAQRRTS